MELMPFRALFSLVYPLQPASLRRKIVEWTPSANVQQMKRVVDIQEEQARCLFTWTSEKFNLRCYLSYVRQLESWRTRRPN